MDMLIQLRQFSLRFLSSFRAFHAPAYGLVEQLQSLLVSLCWSWVLVVVPVAVHHRSDVQVNTNGCFKFGQWFNVLEHGDCHIVMSRWTTADGGELDFSFYFTLLDYFYAFKELGEFQLAVN